MDFVWFHNGVRVTRPPEPWSTERRVERIQRTARDRKISETEERPVPPVEEQYGHHAAQQAYQRAKDMPRERQPAFKAHQIMSSPVVSLVPEASLDEAWAFIRERRLRHVPVLSRENKLVGILSDKDLLREAAGIGKSPSHAVDTSQAQMLVRDLMTTSVLTAHPDTEIRQIARILLEEHIGAMPIVDEREDLIGIITRGDILRTLINHAPLELWI